MVVVRPDITVRDFIEALAEMGTVRVHGRLLARKGLIGFAPARMEQPLRNTMGVEPRSPVW